jgi:hypothetical protein
LVDTVKKQRKALEGIDIIKSLKKVNDNTFIEAKKRINDLNNFEKED